MSQITICPNCHADRWERPFYTDSHRALRLWPPYIEMVPESFSAFCGSCGKQCSWPLPGLSVKWGIPKGQEQSVIA